MKKIYKIIGKFAIVLLICGIIFSGIGLVLGGQNHSLKSEKLKITINPQLKKQEYKVIEEFNCIDLDIDMANVTIKTGEEFAIEYSLYEYAKCIVKDKTLIIEEKNSNFFNVQFDFKNRDTYLTIYIPENVKINIKNIDNSMGNIKISDIKLGELNINADMGKIDIKNVEIESLYVSNSMGDVNFNGIAEDKIIIKCEMGNVNLKGYLKCNIDIESEMGNIDVCTYYNSQNYKCDIDTDMGDKDINYDGGEKINIDRILEIYMKSEMGNIELTFKDKK